MARGQRGHKPGPVKPKKGKNTPVAEASPKARPSDGAPDELTEMEKQDLFLSCKTALATAKGKLAKVVADVRNVKKRIKADGFTVAQVEAAILMETAEGEEKLRVEMQELLQAAKWVGVPWGSQLDMFNEPDRTPAVDKAHDAGMRASMADKSRKAPHAPESPQAASWYAGYDEHQAELAKAFKRSPGNSNVKPFPQPMGEAAE